MGFGLRAHLGSSKHTTFGKVRVTHSKELFKLTKLAKRQPREDPLRLQFDTQHLSYPRILRAEALSGTFLLFDPYFSPCSFGLQLSSPHIFLSHDWPQSIEHYGDLPGLLRRKKFLREDIESRKLGSPPLMGLLNTLKPNWWFSAHLHARFQATVVHGPQPIPSIPRTESVRIQNPEEITIEDDDFEDAPSTNQGAVAHSNMASVSVADGARNPDEITLEDEEEDVDAPPPPPSPPAITRFLALDKCLPNREYLEVIN